MSIVAWILLGLVSGFVASRIVNRRGAGMLTDVVLGIAGAFVGGFLSHAIGSVGVTGLNLRSLLISVLGAILVLITYHAVVRRT